MPGDPAVILAGDSGTPETIEQMRANLGLDKPIYEQFIVWLTKALQGDLGTSPASKVPVADQIIRRFEPTLSIGFLALFLSITMAVPLGVLAAWKQNTWIDRSSMVFAVLAFSIPVFWLEYNMIYLFAVELGWMPALGYKPISEASARGSGTSPFLP